MTRSLFMGAAACLLAACTVETPVADVPSGDCDSAAYAQFVGQDQSALPDPLPNGTRVIPPNSAVTQDYRPDRLNIDLDGSGKITRVWCG